MKASKYILSIEDGAYGYQTTPLFNDLNLKIEQGKFYGLIGPNGSGKTTLINLLMGLKRLDSGTVYFKSKSLEKIDKKHLSKELALVPQDFTLGFSYSVFDVVMMGRHPYIPRFSHPTSKDMEIVRKALYQMDIEHLSMRPVTDLSGGEKQRVIVARTLAQNTQVLIMDEATSSLDIQHTIEIMRIVKDRVKEKGVTVVAAIHDLNLAAAFCDELIVLKNTSIYCKGSVIEVLNSSLLSDVFSVKAKVLLENSIPRINFDLLGS